MEIGKSCVLKGDLIEVSSFQTALIKLVNIVDEAHTHNREEFDYEILINARAAHVLSYPVFVKHKNRVKQFRIIFFVARG